MDHSLPQVELWSIWKKELQSTYVDDALLLPLPYSTVGCQPRKKAVVAVGQASCKRAAPIIAQSGRATLC
jgi:hypothetical protein